METLQFECTLAARGPSPTPIYVCECMLCRVEMGETHIDAIGIIEITFALEVRVSKFINLFLYRSSIKCSNKFDESITLTSQ
jgi:hypothetical protein